MSTVLITGASRGVGLEMVRQYAQAGWDVIATCRDPERALDLQTLARRWSGAVLIDRLDVTRPEHVEWLAGKHAAAAIDVLINNAGDFGPRGVANHRLHKQFFGSIDYDAWRQVLETNTLAPIRIAEAFVEHVERSQGRRMTFLSSTIGSNVEGVYDGFAYSTSKAALNKAVSTLGRILRPRGIIAAALCPGHVRTAMGGPGANLEPAESVAGLRRVIGALTDADSGQFIRYNGERVAW